MAMTGSMWLPDVLTDRRKWLALLGQSMRKAGSKNELLDLIDRALAVAPPAGEPATLETGEDVPRSARRHR
ncbi:hypothetical protein [Streptomyces resistomycificus]|uniref:hypothetical protein n=1 Tax=Streptomyces resistomycificus TaxID=67356 RepID=UPI000B30AC51|nr:hypothetical protein [Streptomyces resistomycificus]